VSYKFLGNGQTQNWSKFTGENTEQIQITNFQLSS
jgi:hypothetical protein